MQVCTGTSILKCLSCYIDHQKKLVKFALIQYLFDGNEHTILVKPHGNSKKSASFVRTLPSTMKSLKDSSKELTPKFAISKISIPASEASSAGSLPRLRQQASDIRRSQSIDKDPLLSIMHMCKVSEGKGSHFVRVVTGAPEPMAVLSFDWILDDIVRLSTHPENFSILGVDPTFNLGAFHVTVVTYEHKMLYKYNSSINDHPIMMVLYSFTRKRLSLLIISSYLAW